MKARIEELYGSVLNMLKENKSFISDAYMYQILNGRYTNFSLLIAQELKRMLKLETMEELIDMVEEIKNEHKEV